MLLGGKREGRGGEVINALIRETVSRMGLLNCSLRWKTHCSSLSLLVFLVKKTLALQWSCNNENIDTIVTEKMPESYSPLQFTRRGCVSMSVRNSFYFSNIHTSLPHHFFIEKKTYYVEYMIDREEKIDRGTQQLRTFIGVLINNLVKGITSNLLFRQLLLLILNRTVVE